MKTKIFIIIGILWSSITYGQRHIQGVKTVNVGGGATSLSKFGEAGLTLYQSNTFSYSGNLLIEAGKYKTISFSAINLFLDGIYTPFNIKDALYLNLGGGLASSFNMIKVGEGGGNKSGFNIGGSLFIQPELYVTNKFAFYLQARKSFFVSRLNGNNPPLLIGGGLKFSF